MTSKEPLVSNYSIRIRPTTIDTVTSIEIKIDERLSLYEKLIFDNKQKYEKLQEHLIERKEEVAGVLLTDTANYQTWARSYVATVNIIEETILEDYYNCHKQMKSNFRRWRKHYVGLLTNSDTRQYLLAEILKNPDFSAFFKPNFSGVRETRWTSMKDKILSKEAIDPSTKVKIGEGAFGTVYRGIVHGTIVSIKELKEDTITKMTTAIKFENEILLFSQLQHENILKFMGACVPMEAASEKLAPYYALLTELADNGSLYNCLYSEGVQIKFSFPKKLEIVSQIVAGMTYLHTLEKPVYHLDLKSSNILLDENYCVRIADFGLSKLFGEHFFSMGSFIGGTPFYMAPEILTGKYQEEHLGKADVYSFGILVNELLMEQTPYRNMIRSNSYEDLKKRVTGGVEPGRNRPYLATGKVNGVLKEMIKKCWHLDYKVRPTFLSLQKEKPWEEAKLALTRVSQDLKKKLMIDLFKGEIKTVPFGLFLKALKEYLSESSRLFVLEDLEGPFNTTPYVRTLLRAFNLSTGREHISQESILLFLSWVSLTKSTEILDQLYHLFTSDFFFWNNGTRRSK